MITRIKEMTDFQKLGLDLYNGSIEKYSVTEGENAIRNAIVDACGGKWNMYSFLQNKYRVFEIMAETLTVATGSLVEQSFGAFTETRTVNLGDTTEFIVEDNSLFRVATVASGENDFRRQKVYNHKVSLTMFELALKIYTEFDLFMAGRVNWQSMVNRVAKSFNHQLAINIYNAIYDSYTTLTAPYQVNGTYTTEKLLDLCTHIQSATGQSVSIYGTKKSLSKVVDATYLSEARKDQMNDFGHYKDFQGVPMIELPQGHKTGTSDFAVNDSFLLVVPDGEKICKLLLEGDAYVIESTDFSKRNDQQMEYSFARRVGLGILKADAYGIFRIG